MNEKELYERMETGDSDVIEHDDRPEGRRTRDDE